MIRRDENDVRSKISSICFKLYTAIKFKGYHKTIFYVKYSTKVVKLLIAVGLQVFF